MLDYCLSQRGNVIGSQQDSMIGLSTLMVEHFYEWCENITRIYYTKLVYIVSLNMCFA